MLPPTCVAREPALAEIDTAACSDTSNQLLASLPFEILAELWPRLERIELPLLQEIMMPGRPIAAVYFPETAYASMLTHLSDGATAEVGMIGREGMVGLPLLLGASNSAVSALIQGPGTMLRLDAGAFLRALDSIPGLLRLLLRYALAFHEQVAQTAACNGHHPLEQRLARWLLMARDRCDDDEFPMTQEFLALMLCVSRPGVSIAARLFQQAGLISYRQGRMRILDRDGLSEAACECYDVTRGRFSELMGRANGSTPP